MRATRDLAARYGALLTVAVMDLQPRRHRADGLRPRRLPGLGPGLRRGQPSVRAGHRAGGAPLARRGARARGRRRRRWPRPPPRRSPTTPTTRGSSATCTVGCCVTRAFVAGDLDALPGHLETMMDVRPRPRRRRRRCSPAGCCWATLHAIDDDDLGVAQRAENAGAVGRMGMAQFGLACRAIEAVVLGPHRRPRGRDRAHGRGPRGAAAPAAQLRAHARAGAAHRAGRVARRLGRPGARGCARRRRSSPRAATTARPAAAARCWARRGRRCRAAAGATRTCRRRCAALGVTSREVDVLKLVATGLSNREIGERLYLATKTVERHVGSLLGAHRRRRPGRARRAGAGARPRKLGDSPR